MNKYCYMTFADIKFMPCVIRQNQRLKYLKSKYPYIVLIDENDIECELLLKENNINYKKVKQDFFKKTNSGLDRLSKTINKFKIINYLNEFEKILFLDADSIILKNLDNIFDEIQDDIQFYCQYNLNRCTVQGTWFIITNKLNIKNFLTFLNKNKNKYCEDESLLFDYFKNYDNIKCRFSSIELLHFYNYLKLFQMFDKIFLIKKIFYDYDEETFNKFINEKESLLFILNEKWNEFLDLIVSYEYEFSEKGDY